MKKKVFISATKFYQCVHHLCEDNVFKKQKKLIKIQQETRDEK